MCILHSTLTPMLGFSRVSLCSGPLPRLRLAVEDLTRAASSLPLQCHLCFLEFHRPDCNK